MTSSLDWSLLLGVATAIGTIALAVIGGLALYVAKEQIISSRKSAANSLFVDHLKLCLQYPEFSAKDRPYNDDIRYENFMAITLTTYEEILDSNPGDKAWEESIKYNLEEDARFMVGLKDNTSHFDEGYSSALMHIVDIVIAEFRQKEERQDA